MPYGAHQLDQDRWSHLVYDRMPEKPAAQIPPQTKRWSCTLPQQGTERTPGYILYKVYLFSCHSVSMFCRQKYTKKMDFNTFYCLCFNKTMHPIRRRPPSGMHLAISVRVTPCAYLYSCQLLIWISSCFMAQKALMKALAKRALVISGMLWSMAPRRMR